MQCANKFVRFVNVSFFEFVTFPFLYRMYGTIIHASKTGKDVYLDDIRIAEKLFCDAVFGLSSRTTMTKREFKLLKGMFWESTADMNFRLDFLAKQT